MTYGWRIGLIDTANAIVHQASQALDYFGMYKDGAVQVFNYTLYFMLLNVGDPSNMQTFAISELELFFKS